MAKESCKESFSTNGQAIKALRPPFPSSLLTIGFFLVFKKFFLESPFFP